MVEVTITLPAIELGFLFGRPARDRSLREFLKFLNSLFAFFFQIGNSIESILIMALFLVTGNSSGYGGDDHYFCLQLKLSS